MYGHANRNRRAPGKALPEPAERADKRHEHN
jgi:hypothetical protein